VYKINIIIIYFLPQEPHPGLTEWMRAIIEAFKAVGGFGVPAPKVGGDII